jgi:hypothetical protein
MQQSHQRGKQLDTEGENNNNKKLILLIIREMENKTTVKSVR